MVKYLHIKNEIGELNRLNEFIDESFKEIDRGDISLMNLKLAIEEAVVNVITYAYPGKNNMNIEICMEYIPYKLTVTITDTGIPFDPTQKKEPDISLPLEERPIGGLGTFLVKQLMTEVSYIREGNKNILKMIKEIS